MTLKKLIILICFVLYTIMPSKVFASGGEYECIVNTDCSFIWRAIDNTTNITPYASALAATGTADINIKWWYVGNYVDGLSGTIGTDEEDEVDVSGSCANVSASKVCLEIIDASRGVYEIVVDGALITTADKEFCLDIDDAYTPTNKVDDAVLCKYVAVANRFNDTTDTVDVGKWSGTTVVTPDTAGYPKVTIKDGTGTGEIDTLSGSIVNVDTCDVATSVTNAITLPTIPADWITAAGIEAGAITSSEAPNLDLQLTTFQSNLRGTLGANIDMTKMSQKTTAGGYDPDIHSLEAIAENAPAAIADAVLDEDMTAHQTQGTLGQAIGDPAADATKMWNVINQMADKLPTNNFMGSGVVGNMDDEINAILVDTAEIGVAGAGLTAIDLPNQIMDITGSLSGSVGSVTGAVDSVTGNVGGNVVGSVASVTNMVTANVTQISGDSVAADNVEAAYDGTGYLGDGIAVTVTSVAGTLPYAITITETGIITVDNQFAEGDKKLYCAKEERAIVATDDNTADTITVEPGNPFNTTPSGTCYIK